MEKHFLFLQTEPLPEIRYIYLIQKVLRWKLQNKQQT